ncbi:hypothetical protein [Natronocella acetinitrilica]|nr:hypothetical protein [Natronocella acetinitrilica]
MGSYARFAQADLCDLAALLDAHFDVVKVRRLWRRHAARNLAGFEADNSEFVADLLKRTPAQRPALVRRLIKQSTPATAAVIIVMAVLACQRAIETIELRDAYAGVLSPGGSNRGTVAGLYRFTRAMAAIQAEFAEYRWPHDAFQIIGLASDKEDEEDEEDEQD